MNTPRTPKRFDKDKWREAFREKAGTMDGHWSCALVDADVALEFAAFVTSFTELEHSMERFMAHLMGTDWDVAAIAMRSVVSIQARISLMESVLKQARRNAQKGVEFDEVLAEFSALRKIRNDFVHGRWQTSMDTGKVYLTKPGGDPLLLDHSAAELFDVAELQGASRRITGLTHKIFLTIGRDIAQEQSEANDGEDAPLA